MNRERVKGLTEALCEVFITSGAGMTLSDIEEAVANFVAICNACVTEIERGHLLDVVQGELDTIVERTLKL